MGDRNLFVQSVSLIAIAARVFPKSGSAIMRRIVKTVPMNCRKNVEVRYSICLHLASNMIVLN